MPGVSYGNLRRRRAYSEDGIKRFFVDIRSFKGEFDDRRGKAVHVLREVMNIAECDFIPSETYLSPWCTLHKPNITPSNTNPTWCTALSVRLLPEGLLNSLKSSLIVLRTVLELDIHATVFPMRLKGNNTEIVGLH